MERSPVPFGILLHQAGKLTCRLFRFKTLHASSSRHSFKSVLAAGPLDENKDALRLAFRLLREARLLYK